jgi:hypothetical protein
VLSCMRELASQYPRFGYRRIQIFLQREGHTMSSDRTYRLWKLADLQVPRRRPRRRIASGRPRPLAPTGARQMWAYDFVFDACANGQQLPVPQGTFLRSEGMHSTPLPYTLARRLTGSSAWRDIRGPARKFVRDPHAEVDH